MYSLEMFEGFYTFRNNLPDPEVEEEVWITHSSLQILV